MGRSTMMVDCSTLVEVVRMIEMIGITVVGSKEADNAVALVIEGDIVPDAPEARILWESVRGQIYAQITAHCEVVV